YV
ncbi:zf-CCHC domain-containing protein/UBN2 domain-containing protein, partial [Cephalotus follicularis]